MPLVSGKLPYPIGNGLKVKFWRDGWRMDTPLCVSFLSLFALANSKEASVSDC